MSSEAVEKDSKLKLILSPDQEKGKAIPPEEFFQAQVFPLLAKVAKIVSAKCSALEPDSKVLEVSDRSVKGLRKILTERSLDIPKFSGFAERADWWKGKLVVKLVEHYSCHVLVAWDAEDPEIDEFAKGRRYYFEAADFEAEDGGIISYKDKPYWEVLRAVQKNEGGTSESAKNIKRVKKIIRDLLYKTKLKEEKREQLAAELVELRLKVGEAARLVINDLIMDYDEADGWVEVVGDNDDDFVSVSLVEDSMAYIKAMARLQVGKYDLRKFV